MQRWKPDNSGPIRTKKTIRLFRIRNQDKKYQNKENPKRSDPDIIITTELMCGHNPANHIQLNSFDSIQSFISVQMSKIPWNWTHCWLVQKVMYNLGSNTFLWMKVNLKKCNAMKFRKHQQNRKGKWVQKHYNKF